MVSSQDGCSKREIAVQIGDDIYAELPGCDQLAPNLVPLLQHRLRGARRRLGSRVLLGHFLGS